MGFITWTEHLCNTTVDDAFHPTCRNTAYNDTSSIYERFTFSVTLASELGGNKNSISSVKLLAAEPKCRSPSIATHPTIRDEIFTGETRTVSNLDKDVVHMFRQRSQIMTPGRYTSMERDEMSFEVFQRSHSDTNQLSRLPIQSPLNFS